MSSNFGRNRTEMNAAAIIAEAKDAAKGLVEREYSATHSLMLAYERVGQMIGRSDSFVRQFVTDQYESVPNLVVGMNLIELYRRMCAPYQRTCAAINKDAERMENETAARDRAMDKGMGEA